MALCSSEALKKGLQRGVAASRPPCGFRAILCAITVTARHRQTAKPAKPAEPGSARLSQA